ncbi:MAG TPA: RluA family pseudouridine synthase [Bacteroidales bacterium]|nr:RluA family pseudouridine synthase [Bacteroidales bacterium]
MVTVPEILYEDNHLIAVNKRISDIVQGDRTGDVSLDKILKDFIRKRDSKPGNVFMGIPHRLDRPVSGVMVFAKTSKALSRMNALFRDKKTVKIYWAIVRNHPPEEAATLVHYLRKNEKQNKSYPCSPDSPGAKEASLSYRLAGASENYFLLEVELHTGRHHQIRAQLAAIGCPIKGDLKYGFPRSNKSGGISLHAREISFTHPVKGTPLQIVAKPPADDIFGTFPRP